MMKLSEEMTPEYSDTERRQVQLLQEPTHRCLRMEPAFADNCISAVCGLAGPDSMLLLTM